jgi:hypothetical protein
MCRGLVATRCLSSRLTSSTASMGMKHMSSVMLDVLSVHRFSYWRRAIFLLFCSMLMQISGNYPTWSSVTLEWPNGEHVRIL